MSRRPWRSTSPASTPPQNGPTSGWSTCNATTAAGGTTTCPTASVEEAKLDTNVCAYIATGVWHHWLCTWDRAFVDHLWPTVQRALDWVLSMRREDGTVLWACTAEDRPWNYALLTGSSSIAHALRCGANLAALTNEPRPDWIAAADRLCFLINEHPRVFEPKDRWAMDWYYPVLSGCLVGERAKVRMADGWSEFAMEHRGIRCVSDEPWITASETAECAMAHAAIGDLTTATDLISLDATASPRRRRVLHRHRLSRQALVPVRRGLGVHRCRGRYSPPTRSMALHRPMVCSCPALHE